jgi:hypothetical protein
LQKLQQNWLQMVQRWAAAKAGRRVRLGSQKLGRHGSESVRFGSLGLRRSGHRKFFQSPGLSPGFGLSHVGSPAKAYFRPGTWAGLGRAQMGWAGLGFGL